jgi:hypothetical protein
VLRTAHDLLCAGCVLLCPGRVLLCPGGLRRSGSGCGIGSAGARRHSGTGTEGVTSVYCDCRQNTGFSGADVASESPVSFHSSRCQLSSRTLYKNRLRSGKRRLTFAIGTLFGRKWPIMTGPVRPGLLMT